MSVGTPLVIGTRGSDLALWQARWVAARLAEKGHATETVIIRTEGDRAFDVDLAAGSERGVFVRDIEQALLDGRIHLAVHSLKDLPTTPTEGLCVGAVPERADVGEQSPARFPSERR